MVIYQLLPRLFGNTNTHCIPSGSIEENGVGKFEDITLAALTAIKRLGVTHIWLTGILEHASTTSYTAWNIPPVEPSLVKGKAGSPYAIRDYYDVSPDLACDVPRRMEEFSLLVERCHSTGLKVIIDFVPNHLFRQYASDSKPLSVSDFGAQDNPQLAFSPQNNFYYLPGTSFIPPVPAGEVAAPVSAGEVAAPVLACEVATPIPACEVAAPAPACEVAAPVSAGEVAAPVLAGEVAAPVPASEVATLVSAGEVAAPVLAGEVAAPVLAGESTAPVSAGEVATLVSACEVAAPVSVGEVAALVLACEVAAPVSACEVAAPVPAGEVATLVSAGEVATPVSAGEVAALVPACEVAAPVSACEVAAPVGAYCEVPAKATGNDCFAPNPTLDDWYETVKLNYGVDMQHDGTQYFDPIPDTWHKMRDILSFWAEKGVDGFRCDMAEMVPAPFWAWVIPQIKGCIFIAEIYKPAYYRDYLKSGFNYLYDKVGLYDTLRAVLCGGAPASDLSRCWQRLSDLQPFMLNFLENHDEQRIASPLFWGQDGEVYNAAPSQFSLSLKAIPALVLSTCLNTAPFMLYAGQEFGERGMDQEGFSGIDGRTSIFDYWSVETLRRFNNHGTFNEELLSDVEQRIYALYTKLFSLLSSSAALANGATFDLGYANQNHAGFNPQKHFAFFRHTKTPQEETLLIALNFSDSPANLLITIPAHAFGHLHIPDYTPTQTPTQTPACPPNSFLVSDALLFDTENRPNKANPPQILSSITPFPLSISAHGAVIVGFKFFSVPLRPQFFYAKDT